MPIWKKLLFSVCAILGALGALELLADAIYAGRALWRTSTTNPEPDVIVNRFQPLRYEYRPHSQNSWVAGATLTVNRLGLRGPELEEPKRRVRVFCIGDSCTHGYAPDVTDDKTYPALLGLWLDGKAPGQFEVVNGGMPSFGTLDCLNFFLYKGFDLQPDYVIILCGWNDSYQVHGLRPAQPEPAGTAFDSSSLVRLGKAAARRVQRARQPPPLAQRLKQLPAAADQLSEPAFARMERILTFLVHSCRMRHARPILVTLPHFTRPEWSDVDSLSDAEMKLLESSLIYLDLSPKGWHEYVSRTNQMIAGVARSHQVPLVPGESVNQPEWFVDVAHLNARGNQVLSERIGPAILDSEAKVKKAGDKRHELAHGKGG